MKTIPVFFYRSGKRNQLRIKKHVFFFNANSLVLGYVDANSYQNKIPEDDLSKKTLYNTLLLNISFPLKIGTLSVRNLKLVYKEEINFQKAPAIVTFRRFNLNTTKLQSGFGLKNAADLGSKVNCLFIKKSSLKTY
ncbi:hypothetical protein OIU80_20730 [Flavobacterium sp. LS1R47]|uniref:Uncharacterized protein n=1 Tax=Flavobacterium frigoritolerans TaxID=2987686 RepID=A0A9X3CAP1_9FLAO|nr:hypothetical protein [Flavobacterium frigoritolerans]MCV9934708.1 hypothetical protein [Flavobacterium frigoritolerans]